MREIVILLVLCAPLVAGLVRTLVLYQRAKKTATSAQTMEILDKLLFTGIGLAVYTVLSVIACAVLL